MALGVRCRSIRRVFDSDGRLTGPGRCTEDLGAAINHSSKLAASGVPIGGSFFSELIQFPRRKCGRAAPMTQS